MDIKLYKVEGHDAFIGDSFLVITNFMGFFHELHDVLNMLISVIFVKSKKLLKFNI